MDFQIYKLVECGFYDKNDDATLCFGELNHWWQSFSSWAKNRPFDETKTYRYDKNGTPSVYCSTVGEFDDNGRSYYYLSLWNETPSRDGMVQSMSRKSVVNNVKVLENKIENDSIPGWASNFIFDHKNGYIIALTPNNGFSGRSQGFRQMGAYFTNYLRIFSDYCNFKSNNKSSTKTIHGHSLSEDDEPSKYNIKFKTEKVTRPSDIDRIKNNINSINKLVYRVKMDFKEESEYMLLSKICKCIHISPGIKIAKPSKTYTFTCEIPWFPTITDLNNALEEYKDSSSEAGVRFSFDSNTIYWFNKILAKDSITLDDMLERKTVLNHTDFINIWKDSKEKILAQYPPKIYN